MYYETIKQLKDGDFKRLTGIQRETFNQMLAVIEKGLRDFGRPTKLSRADQLLMTLMYWREYRTEFHIAQSYGVSEATVCRTIRRVEDTLVRSKKFRVPGKKTLQASDTVFEVLLVDVSEQPVERPKKAKNGIIVAKRSNIPKRRK
jgi:DDE superfamily endonuclease